MSGAVIANWNIVFNLKELTNIPFMYGWRKQSVQKLDKNETFNVKKSEISLYESDEDIQKKMEMDEYYLQQEIFQFMKYHDPENIVLVVIDNSYLSGSYSMKKRILDRLSDKSKKYIILNSFVQENEIIYKLLNKERFINKSKNCDIRFDTLERYLKYVNSKDTNSIKKLNVSFDLAHKILTDLEVNHAKKNSNSLRGLDRIRNEINDDFHIELLNHFKSNYFTCAEMILFTSDRGMMGKCGSDIKIIRK
jgi:hypothetical protein